MRNIVTASEDFIKKMDLIDMGFFKICLYSLGLFSGVCVTRKNSKKVGFWALVVYIITFVPLMSKFVQICKDQDTTK